MSRDVSFRGYYHRVLPVPTSPSDRKQGISPGALQRHVHLLQTAGYVLKTATEVARPGPNDKFASLTFDDGFEDNLTLGLPALKSLQVVATVFVTTPQALQGAKSNFSGLPMLTKDGIGALAKAGWEIGAHSCTHRRLSELSPEEQLEEMSASKRYLEDILGQKVTSLAYPYGVYTAKTMELAEKAGFEFAFTTSRSGANTGRFDISRTSLGGYGMRAWKQEMKLRWHLRRF
jgi:peptidoglycan/xylan/chitin deacetylase (PgdA/CDA1 family)